MSKKIFGGVDEVGRGCLAGPVVSCALILKKNINKRFLKDSKAINFKDRNGYITYHQFDYIHQN